MSAEAKPVLLPRLQELPSLLNLSRNQVRHLTEKEREAMESLSTMDWRPLPESVKNTFGFEIIDRRLKVFSPKTKITEAAIAMIAICGRKPGEWAMFAWMLHSWAKQRDFEPTINMEVLCVDIIPMGVPNEQYLCDFWDAQKKSLNSGTVRSDNMLDDPSIWA